MTEHGSGVDRGAGLRRRAEEHGEKSGAVDVQTMSEEDVRGLLHELQVHQIQLEMQNEELRTAQEQLAESFSKYSDLYDFAPVGYVTSNREGLILEANLTFAGQLGIERGRLINTLLWLYATPPHRGRFRAYLHQVFNTHQRQTCEVKLERPGGSELYVQLDSIWMPNVDGSQSCRTSVTDISTRKEAERELLKIQGELERRVEERTAELSANARKFRKLSQEFSTLLNAISDTLILLSPKMEVLWTNTEDGPELNETASEAARRYCYELLHDRSTLPNDCPVSKSFNSGEKTVAVVAYNGAVLNIGAYPIKEGQKVTSVLLMVSDITEKMSMQAEAIQTAHLASLGELAAGIAHEINNPITGIINYGQILINECSPGSLENDIGERIVKEGERVGRIVKSLLSYARDGQREKKLSRVPDTLEESLTLTVAQIRKEGIGLKIDLPDDLPEVNVDFQKLQQAFINIISNARYALNEKYPGRHRNKLLQITGEKVTLDDRPYVRISFHDRGIGISPHELSLVTKPFFSTKPFGKGTGLGLNITHKIIADHGGRLSFESIEGEFTKVIVDLPASGDIERDGK